MLLSILGPNPYSSAEEPVKEAKVSAESDFVDDPDDV